MHIISQRPRALVYVQSGIEPSLIPITREALEQEGNEEGESCGLSVLTSLKFCSSLSGCHLKRGANTKWSFANCKSTLLGECEHQGDGVEDDEETIGEDWRSGAFEGVYACICVCSTQFAKRPRCCSFKAPEAKHAIHLTFLLYLSPELAASRVGWKQISIEEGNFNL